MKNEFGFWEQVDKQQYKYKTYIIETEQREEFFSDFVKSIREAMDEEMRASIWWNKMFCGVIKDNQGQPHYLCEMDMSCILSPSMNLDPKETYKQDDINNLCTAFLDTRYRKNFFGSEDRIFSLSNREKSVGEEFYGPYDKKLSTGQYGWLSKKFGEKKFQEVLMKWVQENVLKLNESKGQNLIIYGAPGTGKSYWVNHYNDKGREEERLSNLQINEAKIIRIVFHPEYTYFDFVGSYRPEPVLIKGTDVDGKEVQVPHITYKFVPGPFTEVLVEALKDKNTMYTLLIEELNRADAAAVFGDVFQLLDRKNGESEYSIMPSQEWLACFEEKLKDYEKIFKDIQQKGVRIPSNMNIIATMNSADQGVHLLDTAFKRRWRYKYISVSEAVEKAPEKCKSAKILYDNKMWKWFEFIKAVNSKLSELNISEDRWVGPYFATEQELESDGEAAVEKVLFYLWDDVLRNSEDRNKFFGEKAKSLGDLIDEDNNKKKQYQKNPVILVRSVDTIKKSIDTGEK